MTIDDLARPHNSVPSTTGVRYTPKSPAAVTSTHHLNPVTGRTPATPSARAIQNPQQAGQLNNLWPHPVTRDQSHSKIRERAISQCTEAHSSPRITKCSMFNLNVEMVASS